MGGAPLWLCFLAQFVSVLGDAFGQRCSRVYHTGSRRRFIFALVIVSCLLQFVTLTIVQLASPDLTTQLFKSKKAAAREGGNTAAPAPSTKPGQLVECGGTCTQLADDYVVTASRSGTPWIARIIAPAGNSFSPPSSASPSPTTPSPTTSSPTTPSPSTPSPTTSSPSTPSPTTPSPSTPSPTAPESHMIDVCSHEFRTNHPNATTDCFSQGPLTMYKLLAMCPILLIDGVVNIFYYIGEATLYSEPLGLVLLVLASLTSSFLITPLQMLLDVAVSSAVPLPVTLLGIAGAIVCLVEREPKGTVRRDIIGSVRSHDDDEKSNDEDDENSTYSYSVDVTTKPGRDSVVRNSSASGIENYGATRSSPGSRKLRDPSYDSTERTGLIRHDDETDSPVFPTLSSCVVSRHRSLSTVIVPPKEVFGMKLPPWLRTILRSMPLLVPFLLLSFTYATWFVMMNLFTTKCDVNTWGYNAVDQVLLPLYVYPLFVLIDLSPARQLFETSHDQQESFWEAFKGALSELKSNKFLGLLNMCVYRTCINARAIMYTYVTAMYDLNESYLELTLIRVGLSCMASIALVLLTPKLIRTTPEERRKATYWPNVVCKIIGSGFIGGSLYLLKRNGGGGG